MFYKSENNNLYFGVYVQSGSYSLFDFEKETYTLPIDGWYWFDTMEEAKAFFNIED